MPGQRLVRPVKTIAPIAGLLLLLAACGGSDKDETPTGHTGPEGSEALEARGAREAAETGETASDLADLAATRESREAGRRLEVDACRLIEISQVSELVGNPVEEGRAMGSMHCMWDTGEPDQTSLSLTAFVKQEGVRKMEEICADMRSAGEGQSPAPRDVTGVGEEAWWTYSSAPALNTGQLWVCDAAAVLGLTLAGGGGEDAMLQAARDLAKKALERV